MEDIIQNLHDSGILVDGFDNTSIGYLAHPLNKIWEQRNMKPPPDDASHWKSILHDIRGEHDICMYYASSLSICSSHLP